MEAFVTVREQLLAEYVKAGVDYRATTQPYKSRQPFRWIVVDPLPVAPPATVAHAILEKQEREFFSYGIGEQIPWALGTTAPFRESTEADTNQGDGRNTNGAMDFCIESVSCSSAGIRPAYTAAQAAAVGVTNATVLAAYQGQVQICDPGTLMAPPQAWSPFNLEDAMFEQLKSVSAVRFQWDRGGFIGIGTLDQVPEGAARSLLRASGDPRVDNRYKIEEGYAWRRKSKTDADFVTNVKVMNEVVCPINLVALGGQGAVATMPTYLFQDIIFRVHGMGLSTLGQNAGA